MTMEKTSLQKCLLYFESLHGRPVRPASVAPLMFFYVITPVVSCCSLLSLLNPLASLVSVLPPITRWFLFVSLFLSAILQSTRQERTLMKSFYDRYRLLKQLLLSSAAAAVITTIVS